MSKIKTFRIHWLDGSIEDIYGATISDAFMRAGYGGGAVDAIDYFEDLDKNDVQKCYVGFNIPHSMIPIGTVEIRLAEFHEIPEDAILIPQDSDAPTQEQFNAIVPNRERLTDISGLTLQSGDKFYLISSESATGVMEFTVE